MSRQHRGRPGSAIGITILVAAICAAPSRTSRATDRNPIDVAAERLISRLLDVRLSEFRPPINSDGEHARSIDPVLTGEAAVWTHEALPSAPVSVMGGRVFTYRDVPYDPLEAPVLKIRPIDGGRRIPFVIQVVFQPEGTLTSRAVLNISLPAPPIFNLRLSEVTAWGGPHQLEMSIESSVSSAQTAIRVPLPTVGTETLDGTEPLITVNVEGEILLDTYQILKPGKLEKSDDDAYPPDVERISRLEMGRDAVDERELRRISEIAATLAPKAANRYEKVEAVNSWVAGSLQYRESPSTRSPLEILEDRTGDCDDHTGLLVAMLRAMGIAARRTTGLLYNLDTLSAHAWVEVALPTRNRDLHWFIVDPTLAGTTQTEAERSSFVQFRDRILLYPLRPTVRVEGARGRSTTDVLFNWRKGELEPFTDGTQLGVLVDRVIAGVDGAFSRQAESLSASNLLLRRESSTIAGSPYLIVDRPNARERDTRIRLRLENEERLVIELVAAVGAALESETDRETTALMRRTYLDFENLFFGGIPAHRNLELVYDRDRHTDRLHTVSLRFGRYLVEHHLERILKKLVRNDILTEAEIASLSEISRVSGGRNLYILQELARRHRP